MPKAKPWKTKFGTCEGVSIAEALEEASGGGLLDERVVVARLHAVYAVQAIGFVSDGLCETADCVLVVGFWYNAF